MDDIKGYWTGYSYRGYIPWLGEYKSFVSEEEYLEYIEMHQIKEDD